MNTHARVRRSRTTFVLWFYSMLFSALQVEMTALTSASGSVLPLSLGDIKWTDRKLASHLYIAILWTNKTTRKLHWLKWASSLRATAFLPYCISRVRYLQNCHKYSKLQKSSCIKVLLLRVARSCNVDEFTVLSHALVSYCPPLCVNQLWIIYITVYYSVRLSIRFWIFICHGQQHKKKINEYRYNSPDKTVRLNTTLNTALIKNE